MSHKLKKKQNSNLKIKPDRVYMQLQVKFKKFQSLTAQLG